jgi:hypothetical protein
MSAIPGAGHAPLAFAVESVAFWAPTLPSWPIARAAFAGSGAPVDPPAARPQPELLAPAERRRAPDSVALALEVALRAVRESGRDPASLPSIFASSEGDLSVNDYMCSTLAKTPTLISPTKFHNSVHNAAAGYWTIGTGSMAASTALSAFDASFGAGLLEAATQLAADGGAVLLVAFDVPATGALASVTRSEGLLACAFVLADAASARDGAPRWQAALVERSSPSVAQSAAARALAGNAMAGALPFLEALAAEAARDVELPLGAKRSLRLGPSS